MFRAAQVKLWSDFKIQIPATDGHRSRGCGTDFFVFIAHLSKWMPAPFGGRFDLWKNDFPIRPATAGSVSIRG
jgi:hypothetical protein